MSLHCHSNLAVSSAKKFNTPLKSSVVLLTSFIFASVSAYADISTNQNIPTNPNVAAQSNLSGFQSNAIGKSGLGTSIRYTEILENNSDSYNQIAVRADKVASKMAKQGPIDIQLTGPNDSDLENGFKQHSGFTEEWGKTQQVSLHESAVWITPLPIRILIIRCRLVMCMVT